MNKPYTTPLRPHKVLGRSGYGGDVHALTLTTGAFAGIVFSYTNVSFEEDVFENENKLKLKFEYQIHEIPTAKEGYDVKSLEKELGDFIVELLYYGLERDHLGFVDSEEEKPSN